MAGKLSRPAWQTPEDGPSLAGLSPDGSRPNRLFRGLRRVAPWWRAGWRSGRTGAADDAAALATRAAACSKRELRVHVVLVDLWQLLSRVWMWL